MKLLKKSLLCLATGSLLFMSCNDDNDEVKYELGDKKGTVLVTFGSSYPDPQETFATIDAAAKTQFPEEEIRWGYTSDLILNKLRQGNGEGSLSGKIIDNDTPNEAIIQMIKEGYSKFTVQSLHVIPGEEYDEMVEATEAIENEYPGIEFSLGRPLLDTDADLQAVAEVLNTKFANELADGPVLFMGHGTPHAADGQYAKFEAKLKTLNENFYVGTVEGTAFDAGESSIGAIITKLNALSVKPSSVTISPLMSIAGDHANNDMNGNTGETDPAEQSWRERLDAEGYTVNCVMKGLGDYAEIDAIWLSHLQEAMNN